MPGFRASSPVSSHSLLGKPPSLFNYEMVIPPLCPALSCLLHVSREQIKVSGKEHVGMVPSQQSADGKLQMQHHGCCTLPITQRKSRQARSLFLEEASALNPHSFPVLLSRTRHVRGKLPAPSAPNVSGELPTSPTMAPALGSLS